MQDPPSPSKPNTGAAYPITTTAYQAASEPKDWAHTIEDVKNEAVHAAERVVDQVKHTVQSVSSRAQQALSTAKVW